MQENKNYSLLECDAVSSGRYLRTVRENVMRSSTGSIFKVRTFLLQIKKTVFILIILMPLLDATYVYFST
jgi:hypothetical protein